MCRIIAERIWYYYNTCKLHVHHASGLLSGLAMQKHLEVQCARVRRAMAGLRRWALSHRAAGEAGEQRRELTRQLAMRNM